MKSLVFVTSVFIIFIGCSPKKDSNQSVVASINGQTIDYVSLDAAIKPELYDQLYKIYLMRKTALESHIKDILLKMEAQKYNQTKDEFLKSFVAKNFSDNKFEAFLAKPENSHIFLVERKHNIYNNKTKKGRAYFLKAYKEYLINQLVDSLKAASNVEVYLSPPVSPYIADNFDLMHFRGNLNAKVTFIEISDPECENCREHSRVYSYLYDKYQNKVKFGYVAFSGYPNLYALALESRSVQDRFWEFKEELYTTKELVDTTELLNIANGLGIDKQVLLAEIRGDAAKQKLEENFRLISSYGIYATPTIIINNKTVYDPSSLEEIENLILKELN